MFLLPVRSPAGAQRQVSDRPKMCSATHLATPSMLSAVVPISTKASGLHTEHAGSLTADEHRYHSSSCCVLFSTLAIVPLQAENTTALTAMHSQAKENPRMAPHCSCILDRPAMERNLHKQWVQTGGLPMHKAPLAEEGTCTTDLDGKGSRMLAASRCSGLLASPQTATPSGCVTHGTSYASHLCSQPGV